MSYEAHLGRNCPPGPDMKPGNGVHLDNDASALKTRGYTIEMCQDLCSLEPQCHCVVRDAHTGECWRRGGCIGVHLCMKNDAYDVFVKLVEQ